ncbi:hypothetical protein JHL18_04965 [Clostridium sp. YIM B02505]|uniref:Uncharacterized protein n=1 Tax=Clostridium yunnanense TaxID=2800325 RepID=A0ABS1EKU5_9CLOT|nr:hypothetical protein [Clostridium yunnanense]MBK1809993.1 hypothetical protein [Clostridium yunnanense]
MSISFVIANTIEEASNNVESIDLEDEINEFLYENREYFGEDISILLKIDPYDDKVFELDELPILIDACILITNKANKIVESSIRRVKIEDIIYFAGGLIEMCRAAIKNNKTIVTLGD